MIESLFFLFPCHLPFSMATNSFGQREHLITLFIDRIHTANVFDFQKKDGMKCVDKSFSVLNIVCKGKISLPGNFLDRIAFSPLRVIKKENVYFIFFLRLPMS